MRIISLTFILFLSSLSVVSQEWDTLRFMTYNLLYYGEVTNFCTTSNNDINEKDTYFKSIAKYVKPDLLLVNEMGASIVYADRIIEKVLNTDGVNRYKRAPIQNNSFSDLVNGVFYDKSKLSLLKQDKLTQATNGSSIVRAIDICTFYYKDPYLGPTSDTTFLYLIGMHLKAGSSASDVSARDIATLSVMDYLVDHYPPGYYITAGDMNVGGSSEQAFQNFLANSNGDYAMRDPLITGSWSSSSSFAYAHTQSTHTESGCHSGGGLDDRFDIVLLSQQIMDDTGSVRFVEGSYKTVGNDGNHYNQSILQGTNNSVPSAVLGALYEMSDHLPVRLDLRFKRLEQDSDTIPTSIVRPAQNDWNIGMVNHHLQISGLGVEDRVVVADLTGRMHYAAKSNGGDLVVINGFESGVYIVTVSNETMRKTEKVFIP
ncbi:MAG: T9SS type A sorting domain-containing protein [Cryomorphaceae bacterium]